MIYDSPAVLAVALLAVFCGYFMFGITSFGASLITAPVLSHFFPLGFVLPVCAMLDISASFVIGARFNREADRTELATLAPFLLIGTILGVTLLVGLPRNVTLTGFGAFLVTYGLYALRAGGTLRTVSRAWGPVAGLAGGTMGALFGIGGPPYAIYLSRRLTDKGALRATISNMVLLSVSMRFIAFAVAGLVLADRAIAFAVLLPAVLAGLWCGHRIHGRVSRDQVMRFLSILVLLIGVTVLVRAIGD